MKSIKLEFEKGKTPNRFQPGAYKENGAQGIRTPLLRFPFRDLNTIETKCTPNLAGRILTQHF